MILNVLIHIIGSASTRAITKDTNLVIRFLAGGWQRITEMCHWGIEKIFRWVQRHPTRRAGS